MNKLTKAQEKRLRKILTKVLGFKYLGDGVRYPRVDNAVIDLKQNLADELALERKRVEKRLKITWDKSIDEDMAWDLGDALEALKQIK